MQNHAARPATAWKRQRSQWKLALATAKNDFTVGGRSAVVVKEIISEVLLSGTISTMVRFHNPAHNNSFIDETYVFLVSIRGRAELLRTGCSLGGTKRRWKI